MTEPNQCSQITGAAGPPCLLLIDASPYIFRSFFALPSSMRTPNGEPINAAHGFASFMIKLLGEEQPSHVGVAFDGSLTSSFRNQIYPEYKANREPPPLELVDQLSACQRIAAALGAETAISEEFEADDLIGSWLARFAPSLAEMSVSIVTSDKDLAQLVGGSVELYDFAKGTRWTSATVREKFGVGPQQLVDYLALAGDPVDNIPGVPGVGPKTAARLLQVFDDLEDLLLHLDRLPKMDLRGAASLQRKLQTHAASARLSLQLARIAQYAEVNGHLDTLSWRGPAERWPELCAELGFESLRERGSALARTSSATV